MDSNIDLLINSVKSNLTGSLQDDLAYLDSIIEKYSDNFEIVMKLSTMKIYLESGGYEEFKGNAAQENSETDTSIADGVLQENTKKKKTKAQKIIKKIKLLLDNSSIKNEKEVVFEQIPQLMNLYEQTTSAAEKEEIQKFANFSRNGLTPLILCCYWESFDAVEFLVKIGADVNATMGAYEINALDYLTYDFKAVQSDKETRRKIEMLLVDNGARHHYCIKRNLGFATLPFCACIAFLFTGIIFSPFLLVLSLGFGILTFFILKEGSTFKAKKKSTARLCAILGGGLALHKFYLNNYSAAFKHLLLSLLTLFIGGIILGFSDVKKINDGKLKDGGRLPLK